MTQTMPVDHGYPSEMPSVGTASSYRVRRLGARPLVFGGTELAMAMSFTPELPYWYEIVLYRTDQQKFVLCIKQFFVSETESDTSDAWEFDTLPEALDAIETYDAGRDVRFDPGALEGVPAAELAARGLQLHAEIKAARAHYAGLAGELFHEMESAA